MKDDVGWYYRNPGQSYAVGWKKIGGEWYYFDEAGDMKTGLINVDEVLELVPYSDGSGEPRFLRVHEKEWKTEDDELHYQFHIRERVAVRKEVNRMQRMEENRAYVRNEA